MLTLHLEFQTEGSVPTSSHPRPGDMFFPSLPSSDVLQCEHGADGCPDERAGENVVLGAAW